jgi:hypothetical protein
MSIQVIAFKLKPTIKSIHKEYVNKKITCKFLIMQVV